MVAIGRTQFTNGIGAIRDLGEDHIAVFGGSGFHYLRILTVEQTEDRAGQRLAVILGLFQHDLVDFILDDRFTSHLAIGAHTEGLYGYVKRVPGRSIGFLEGIGTGNHRNLRNLAMSVRVFAVNGFPTLVIDLDQRTRQFLAAGDVGLCDRNGIVDQMIQDRIFHINGDHIFTGSLIGRSQRDGILLCAQTPSCRHGDFLDVILSMREQSGEGQIALVVRRTGSHQGVGGKLLAASISDHTLVVQAEHEALAGNDFHFLMNHAFLGLSQLQRFLLLADGHADRQIGIGSRNLDLNNGGLFVHGGQGDIIRFSGEHIAVRRGSLLQVILAQRQYLGLYTSRTAGGQCFHQIVLFVEDSAFLTDDVLSGAKLEYGACQIAILKHRAHDGVTPFVGFIFEAHQLLAGLFQSDVPANRGVGNIDGDGSGVIRQSNRELNAGQQHNGRHDQVKHSPHHFHRSFSSLIT